MLAGSRELFEAVLTHIGDGIIVVAASGERLYANDEAARLTGYGSAAELLAAPVDIVQDRFEILHPDGRPMEPSELPGRRVLVGGEAGPTLVRYRERMGEADRVSEVRAVAIRDGAGEPAAVIHFFRDVTARVAAAAESEALYRQAQQTSALLDSLYASAPIGLGFWDRDLRYVRVNDALARINERSPEDHVGLTFAEVVPQLADILFPLARGVLDERRPVIAEPMSAGTPNDPLALRHWLASYYPVLAPDGEAIGIGAVVEDVTERRRAEQRSALQLGVARVLAEAESVADAVPRILETICESVGWDVACYWPLDADQQRLTWVRPGVRVEGFVAMSERSALLPTMIPGRVAETRRPEWLEELPSDGPRASVGGAEGLVSGTAFPIVVDAVVVGVVEAFSLTRRAFDAELLDTLAALGGQLGQFISRKRAEDERIGLLARERQARAEAEAAAATLRNLARFSDAALEHSTLGDLLEALLARIVDVLDADTAAVLLVDDAGLLRLRATVGMEGALERARPIPIGEGLAGRVASMRTPLLVPDLGEMELVSPVLRDRGINSLVAIPLIVDDAVIGVAHAGSEAYAQFTDDDARLLELIGDRISLAINQAALSEAEREAHNRLQFLGEASTLLASSLDVDVTLARVARLAVPHFADWCVVDLVTADGSLERVAVEHVDPLKAEAGRAMSTAERPRLDDAYGIGRAVRTAVPILAEHVDEETLRRLFAARPEYLAGLLELGLRSTVIVPLIARGRTLGALTFVWAETERSYADTDLHFAQELGNRAAVAVDNARLYREAGQSRERLAFLAEASELLGASLDVDVTLARLAALVTGRAADWCTIHVVEEAGARLVAVSHRDPEREAFARTTLDEMTQPRAAQQGVLHVIATGQPELSPEVPAELLDDAARAVGVHSTLIVPLVARGRTVGAMCWAWAETPERYDDLDLALAADLGRRTAMAVDNAQLYREAQERAQAARVLASVGDGVFLIDRHGVIRTWNGAAASATGLRTVDVVDRVAAEVIPGWAAVVAGSRSRPKGRAPRAPSRCRSTSATASCGCRSTASRFPTARSSRSAT